MRVIELWLVTGGCVGFDKFLWEHAFATNDEGWGRYTTFRFNKYISSSSIYLLCHRLILGWIEHTSENQFFGNSPRFCFFSSKGMILLCPRCTVGPQLSTRFTWQQIRIYIYAAPLLFVCFCQQRKQVVIVSRTQQRRFPYACRILCCRSSHGRRHLRYAVSATSSAFGVTKLNVIMYAGLR